MARRKLRIGRPPLPPGERRRHRVAVYVTDAEWARLERLAAVRGLPLTTCGYHLLMRALRLEEGRKR